MLLIVIYRILNSDL